MASILNLKSVTIDPGLLERVPLALCQYHQVLPLAYEDGCVSAAMVYPHNVAARDMLAELLDAAIVPVQTSAAALQETFERLASTHRDAPRFLLHATGASEDALLLRLAQLLAAQEGTECARLDAPDVGASAVLTAAGVSRSKLALLPLPPPAEWAELTLRATTSLLMASTAAARVARPLVVLRGHGADMRALAWAASIARHEDAELTLLILTDAAHYDLHMLLDPETDTGRHVDAAVKLLKASGITPTLRIRQGEAVQQIADEAATGRYDMLMLCAESRGEFAAAALQRVALVGASLLALLICKPNRLGTLNQPLPSNKRRLQRA